MTTMEILESANVLPAENMSGHTKKLRFIIEQVSRHRDRLGRPIELLDFGCGNGSAVSQFLMLDGVHYSGVDIHEPSRAYAEKHFGRSGARFFSEVPRDRTFDVLVYSDVLEHLEQPQELLREHLPLFREDGLLVGCVPNGYGPFENEKRLDRWIRLSAILDLPARFRRRRRAQADRQAAPADLALSDDTPREAVVPYNAESGHLQFFTRGQLERLMAGLGLTLDAFRKGAFIGAPLSERYLFRGESIALWNARVADRLPYWAVSTWLFTASRKP
jgi:SAM-dependent methyltransferase